MVWYDIHNVKLRTYYAYIDNLICIYNNTYIYNMYIYVICIYIPQKYEHIRKLQCSTAPNQGVEKCKLFQLWRDRSLRRQERLDRHIRVESLCQDLVSLNLENHVLYISPPQQLTIPNLHYLNLGPQKHQRNHLNEWLKHLILFQKIHSIGGKFFYFLDSRIPESLDLSFFQIFGLFRLFHLIILAPGTPKSGKFVDSGWKKHINMCDPGVKFQKTQFGSTNTLYKQKLMKLDLRVGVDVITWHVDFCKKSLSTYGTSSQTTKAVHLSVLHVQVLYIVYVMYRVVHTYIHIYYICT